MKTSIRLAACLVALAALTGCATPAPKPGGDLNIVLGLLTPPTGVEAEDYKLLNTVAEATDKDGYAGMAPYLAPMRAALDHAPASYALMEKKPNGDVVVRANSMEDGMLLQIAAMGFADPGKNVNVKQIANVYPGIAMVLGSEAVERGAFAEARGYLDRGLALQPNNWNLLAEKAASYLGEKNWTAALAIADAALASDDLVLVLNNAPFLRKRGFALVEMGRLKEAREAYARALEIDKDDKIAANEIKYIDGLLAGGAPTATTMTSPASKPQ